MNLECIVEYYNSILSPLRPIRTTVPYFDYTATINGLAQPGYSKWQRLKYVLHNSDTGIRIVSSNSYLSSTVPLLPLGFCHCYPDKLDIRFSHQQGYDYMLLTYHKTSQQKKYTGLLEPWFNLRNPHYDFLSSLHNVGKLFFFPVHRLALINNNPREDYALSI